MCGCVMAAREAGEVHRNALVTDARHKFAVRSAQKCVGLRSFETWDTNLSVEARFSRQRHSRCLQHTARGRELLLVLRWVPPAVTLQLELGHRRSWVQHAQLSVRCTQCDNDIGMAPESLQL